MHYFPSMATGDLTTLVLESFEVRIFANLRDGEQQFFIEKLRKPLHLIDDNDSIFGLELLLQKTGILTQGR